MPSRLKSTFARYNDSAIIFLEPAPLEHQERRQGDQIAMYLGIDIGTSGVKAMLIDADNVIQAQANAPLDVARPHPLWSEQHPEDWWSATQAAVLDLPAPLRRNVRAIGLSGQMHGATVLGKDDRPLRPAILWNDGRSHAQCTTLKNRIPNIEAVTGNLVMPGFTAPKLIWLRDHERDVFDKIKTVLLPKDYVRLRMTGEKASDLSDSAGTSWLDVASRKWSIDALAACDLSPTAMPRLHEGCEVTGQLHPELARSWGMDPVPVAAGGGDNAAGAVGVGAVDDGEGLISLGTSGVIFLAGRAFHPAPARAVHAFCHALPDRWHQMSVMLSAASCVDWAARLAQMGRAADLIERAEARGRLDGPEIFLPYLSGERTPHNDPHARGVLFGLDHDSDPAALGQAVMEGVAFAFADGLDALLSSGSSVTTLTAIGGGSRSRYWGRILSAALKRPLILREGGDNGPAFGAAKLARLAAGDGVPDDILAAPSVIDVIESEAADIDCLLEKRSKFSALYNALKSQF